MRILSSPRNVVQHELCNPQLIGHCCYPLLSSASTGSTSSDSSRNSGDSVKCREVEQNDQASHQFILDQAGPKNLIRNQFFHLCEFKQGVSHRLIIKVKFEDLRKVCFLFIWVRTSGENGLIDNWQLFVNYLCRRSQRRPRQRARTRWKTWEQLSQEFLGKAD